MGELGITVPSMQADQEHQSSLLVTSALILLQDEAYGYEAGITIPSTQADQEHQSSLLVTSALQDHILLQDEAYGYEVIAEQLDSKAIVRTRKITQRPPEIC